MQSILDAINEWIKEILIGAINGNLSTMFGDVNEKVGTIAAEVGQTPQGWNAGIFSMIQSLSENVIVPIAGLVITYVLCVELISMVTEKNNMHDIDTFMFFKWFFKAWVAVYLVTHTFTITMAVFDMAQHVVSGAAGVIGGNTNIDVDAALSSMQAGLDAMEIPELLLLVMETSLVSLCMKIMSVLITVFQRGAALYYGLNALSNNMILCDRKQLKNPNGLILGTPGSGKSFAAKREMTNAFLITDDDIIICDPEAEYFSLVQRLGGQVIRLSPAGKGMDGKPQYVNPMDINLNYSEDDNPLALKSDFILSLCELVIGGKEGLQPVEKTVIDRAVRNVYRPFLADPDPAKMPILGDLYNELLKQPEPEAARIAAALELYVSGSLNVFNHRTNVELSNRLVCFDIKQLGKQLKKLGMLIVQDQVWNRVTVNRAEKKATRYYMDEFHLLLKEEQTAAYSVEIWKRFRKWGGIPTAITQNVKDLLSSREVENIFENSDFVLMLNQAQGDRAILAKQLNISPQQMKYVTHTEAGEGLIFYGNVVLPFIDRFPTDTELYRLLTTKPEEVSKP